VRADGDAVGNGSRLQVVEAGIGQKVERRVRRGYPMYAVGMIITQALNGAGDTRTPSFLNLIAFWLTQIPLAWLLASSLALGPNGVFWAIVISESLLTVLGVLVFRRGAWRLQQV
jgi:Na+-driven multidrug efflux pump